MFRGKSNIFSISLLTRGPVRPNLDRIAMSTKNNKDTRIKADVPAETLSRLKSLAQLRSWSIQKTAGKVLELALANSKNK